MQRVSILFSLIFAVILLPQFSLAQKKVDNYQIVKTVGSIGLRISKIEYRQDLTRIYGELIGKPHTAARIDEIVLLSAGRTFKWTDIDGFDAMRYFQWEDDGRIAIEIDFPPMKPLTVFELRASGPNNENLWTVKAVNPTKNVSKNKSARKSK